MPKTGLILPRGRATQYPLFVARAESYWRDRGLVFGADYSAGNRRDLVTGALPTATSTIGGNTALGPGVKTDGTRTGLAYATPPGLPTPFTAISLLLVVDPSNATTGTTLYLASVGATSGDPDWSIILDTTNLGYGIVENSFLRAANGTAVLGKTAILVATMSGSARALYADGVLIASDTGGGSRTGGVLGIGRQGAGTGSHASGVISAAMVFNRALSASEVTDLTMRLRRQMPDTERFRSRYIGATGGTTFTQSLAGSLTSSGALAKLSGKALAGALSSAGVASKRDAKPLAGALSSSGLAQKQTQSAKGGTLTSSGAATKTVSTNKAGALAPSGIVAKLSAKHVAGSLTPSGALTLLKVALLALGGALSSSGSLVKSVRKSLAGAVSPAGSLAKAISRAMVGTLTMSGALAKLAAKRLGGALSMAGALGKFIGKLLAGVLSGIGTLTTSGGTPIISPTVHPRALFIPDAIETSFAPDAMVATFAPDAIETTFTPDLL